LNQPDRRKKLADKLYYHGFNKDDSDRLAGRIIRNLDNYINIQEALVNRRKQIGDRLQGQS